MEQERSLRELLNSLPPYDAEAVEKAYREALAKDNTKVIALDDDPTGVQTVHDIYVYTDWKPETIQQAFDDGNRLSFVLTNSRALTEEQTAQLHKEAAEAIRRAAKASNRPVAVISRGDSTLRGHYPLETATLAANLIEPGEAPFDGDIILPFFLEGGRYTADNIHYVADGDRLVPAGQTEFAKDRTFGYENSDLRLWVEEKTKGAVSAKDVQTISLDELRALDYEGITSKLLALHDFGKLIVNAVDELDVKVFVTALLPALAQGRRFIYRSAAALAKIMGGVEGRPVLTREELVDPINRNRGLIIVGSHVQKTTKQLEELKKREDITFIQFNQHLVVDPKAFQEETNWVISVVEKEIRKGKTCAVYTRRDRFDLNNGNKEDELRLSVMISDAVTSIVSKLTVRPNFIIAKGGITSSEIGTKALACKKALVMGQILPGIPVWKTGEESRFPDMPYVIFPGNVGGITALREAVEKMLPYV